MVALLSQLVYLVCQLCYHLVLLVYAVSLLVQLVFKYNVNLHEFALCLAIHVLCHLCEFSSILLRHSVYTTLAYQFEGYHSSIA